MVGIEGKDIGQCQATALGMADGVDFPVRISQGPGHCGHHSAKLAGDLLACASLSRS